MDGGIYTGGPQPYSNTPNSESRSGNAGTDETRFAMGDHQHPRLASASYVTTAVDGSATVTFTRTFATPPTYTLSPVGDFGQATPMANVVSWVMGSGPTAGQYVGANIKARKPANSAPLAAVTVLGVSVSVGSQVVTPVFSDAGGVSFSCIFLQQS